MKPEDFMFDLADQIMQQNKTYLEGVRQGGSKERRLLARLVAAYDIDNMEEVEAVIEEARSLIS